MKLGVERLLFFPLFLLGIASSNPLAAVLVSTFASANIVQLKRDEISKGLCTHTHVQSLTRILRR